MNPMGNNVAKHVQFGLSGVGTFAASLRFYNFTYFFPRLFKQDKCPHKGRREGKKHRKHTEDAHSADSFSPKAWDLKVPYASAKIFMILSLLILTIGGLCKMENPKATVVQPVRRGNIVNRHANKVTRQH